MTTDHNDRGTARIAGAAPASPSAWLRALAACATMHAAGAAPTMPPRRRQLRRTAPALHMAMLLLATLLSGCGTPLLPLPDTITLPKAPADAPPSATLMLPDETAPLLAYHQQVRRMAQGELLQELAALGLRQPAPRVALQMGMVLLWTRGAADLARAQALFDTVAFTTHPLAPLAALLSAQCQEQRRLVEQGDKQQALLKESQRKIDQLTETLESLKAIERNLPARGTSNERQR